MRLAMNPTNSSRLKTSLSNIIRTSNTILPAVSSGSPPPSVPAFAYLTLPTLPLTPNILPELEEMGIPPLAIGELLEWFDKGCRALRRQTEAAILNPSIQAARSTRAFETAYSKRVDALKERLLKRVHGISNRKSSRAVFKSEYTPLLEKYFEGNAFPSSADRAMLARKTQMTHRQIEVWFQNHRRRAREDGKNLSRRFGDSNPDDYNLDAFDAEVDLPRSASASPCENHKDTSLPRNNTDRSACVVPVFRWISVPTVDIVKSVVPAHAFPAPFRDDSSFPPMPSYCDFEWDRKAPITAQPAKKAKPLDIDAFGLEFQQRLRIFEKPSTKCLKRKRSDDQITTSSSKDLPIVSHTSKAHSQLSASRGSSSITETSERRPLKRRLIETPRRPSRTSLSTRSRSCSDSSSCSFLTSSTSLTSIASPPPLPSPCLDSSSNPLPQHLSQNPALSQNPSRFTSKFVEWSLMPPLTLNCATLSFLQSI